MATIIITAANDKYFELVQGTILSIRQKPQGQNAIIGFFDLGCTPEQLQWLQGQVNIIKQADWEFNFPGINEAPEYLKGLLARPFLRQYFPNFDVYFWIDADAWLQDWRAVELFVKGAESRGLAVVPELDRGNLLLYGGLPEYCQWAYQRYQAPFGKEVAQQLCNYPMLNAGVFALHKDAPHWQVWAECLERGLQRNCSLMTDQLALNLAVYNCGLFEHTEMLPAWCNWTCHYGLPAWDKEKYCLVEPYLPSTPIGIVHLTVEKYDQVELLATDRDVVEASLRYTPQPQSIDLGLFPAGDYVSPGFATIKPDRYFPNMIIGDTSCCPWRYLRREVPHNWYADKRHPSVGFLNRDEAHILYNTALRFKGKRALEIGCWLGWSACHLALAGVELDVIDPLLERPDFYESVSGSLQAANVLNSVRLVPGYSPQKVEELAVQFQRQWSLIFIDGNHETSGPLNDAIICEKFVHEDALILFHDLASPAVAQGLDYLRERGWKTMIYQTMQIMGVAWRGNVEPVIHQPDPNISWQLPEHLQNYSVSGMSNGQELTQELRTTMPQRAWVTALPRQTMLSVQNASLNYSYQGIPLIKNPFDFALYPLLLWNLKPKTIIEIGSYSGGSAVWFGDLLNNFGIDGHVYSIDIRKVTTVTHPRVTFMEGSGRALQEILKPDFLNSLPRPFLVIEDADHFYETTIHVLDFFHPYLREGEYIVVEDGIISDLGENILYNGGPHRALKEFLSTQEGEYEIDGKYCDFFGHNLTWCTNGFLKKLTESTIDVLKLQDINLIIFPDWAQPEERLLPQLEEAIRAICMNARTRRATLLIDTSHISDEDANLAVSGVVMDLFMNENLDVTEGLEISLLGKINQREWKYLLPLIQSRIVIKDENSSAIIEAGAENLPLSEIDSLNN